MNKVKVLICNYKQRHSQIIIKSLESEYEIYSFAKKNIEGVVYNINPILVDAKTPEAILYELKHIGIEIIVPVGIKDFEFYSMHKKLFIDNGIKILISEYSIWEMLNDKNKTMQFANQIGVPIPRTIYLKASECIKQINNCLSYKIVIKSANEGGARFVQYSSSDNETISIIEKFKRLKPLIFQEGLIAQEYIQGRSCAYFCMADDGNILSEFGHIRNRESPPSGGVSTSCESFYNKKMYHYAHKIIKESGYSGVCMVEFKYVAEDDEFYLIEVNPKFWGSVLLSIVSGINFPRNYIRYLNDEDVINSPIDTTRVQHVMGDIMRTIRYRKDLFPFLSDLRNRAVHKDLFYLGWIRYFRYYIGKAIYG